MPYFLIKTPDLVGITGECYHEQGLTGHEKNETLLRTLVLRAHIIFAKEWEVLDL